ncbi:MAG: FIST C-terminal domain-containing protein [Coriobacteriia bacterium]|nr:FIST C-terminal domain-containing protein [Coriobacteriia bacterium]
MKANVGHSVADDAKTAGIQAAAMATEGLDGIKLAFVYASVAYDINEMLAGVKEQLPEVPLIGNTSFTGVVCGDGFISGDSGFVGILALADADAVVGVSGLPRGASARQTGQDVAFQAMTKANRNAPPDYFYMVASPGEEEEYLKGITSVIGRVPMFGGSAADNAIAGEWSLYTGDRVFPDGVAVAFFYTDKPMKNLFTGAYRETADVGLITKVDGKRTLMEINGIPAVEQYAKWVDVDPDSLAGGNLLVATITSPLGVKDRLGDLIAIRHPMNGNEDGSMAIGANLAEKTAVIRMEATVDELIASASETLVALQEGLPGPAAAYHLVHCGGRRAGVGERIDEVVDAVKAVAGDVPFMMEFTFGEYGYEDDGNNTTGGLMLSYTAISK